MDNDRTEMKDILEGDKNQGDETIEIHHGTDRGVELDASRQLEYFCGKQYLLFNCLNF